MKRTRQQTLFARQLRRRQTDAETALWLGLRNEQLEGLKFRRQEPIGPYVVDFVSVDRRLVVEIDGGQHAEEMTGARDEERTRRLGEEGYRVLRFWNSDVLTNLDGVLEVIRKAALESDDA